MLFVLLLLPRTRNVSTNLTNEKLSRDVIGISAKMEPRYSVAHRDALTRTKSPAIRPLSRARRPERLKTLKNVKSAANGEIGDDYVRVLNATARPWPAAISSDTVQEAFQSGQN